MSGAENRPSRIAFASSIILGVLAFYNREWLGLEYLWREVRDRGYVSRDTIDRALQRLVSEGLVEREQRRAKGNKRHYYVYRFNDPNRPYRAYTREEPQVDIEALSYRRGMEGVDHEW